MKFIVIVNSTNGDVVSQVEPGRYRSGSVFVGPRQGSAGQKRYLVRQRLRGNSFCTKLARTNHQSLMRVLLVSCAWLLLCGLAQAKSKTVYVHLLDGDDARGDGNYARPFKSWRVALRHVGSGDTIVAKNGDYRKAGRESSWGGLNLILTMGDQLEPGDPRQPVPPGTPPEAIGVYRYDPANPLTIRAETNQGVVAVTFGLHLARGIVIEGFEIFRILTTRMSREEAQPSPRWNSRR